MQRRAAIWILGAFKTSPSYDIEAIARLVPIKLHLQKLGGKSQLRAYKLPPHHLVCSLIDSQINMSPSLKSVTLDLLTNWQCSLVKGHLVDMANRHNECISPFAPLDLEFSPGLRVIDYFSDHILFNVCDKDKDNKAWSHQLDEMVLESSSSPLIAIIASDVSIKNNVTTSIMHIHTYNKPLTKTIHHTVLVTSTEVELFMIRCSINQAMNSNDITKIIIITDSIHAAQKIFDSSVYPY